MEEALRAAQRALEAGEVPVGAVVVCDGKIVGRGWNRNITACDPTAHAEIMALRNLGRAPAPGATMYVTLEPCSTHGRTPPCVQALIGARVGRVVYAIGDPNPLVNGAGVAALRAAGIETVGDVLAAEARALNPGFFKRMRSGLPWVRVKLGASLDGRTALANGESRWITGPAARADAQRFRARSSVVLSGSGTVLADDPALNVRLEGVTRQPLRLGMNMAGWLRTVARHACIGLLRSRSRRVRHEKNAAKAEQVHG